MVLFADEGKMWGISIESSLLHNLLKDPRTDFKTKNSEKSLHEVWCLAREKI